MEEAGSTAVTRVCDLAFEDETAGDFAAFRMLGDERRASENAGIAMSS